MSVVIFILVKQLICLWIVLRDFVIKRKIEWEIGICKKLAR